MARTKQQVCMAAHPIQSHLTPDRGIPQMIDVITTPLMLMHMRISQLMHTQLNIAQHEHHLQS